MTTQSLPPLHVLRGILRQLHQSTTGGVTAPNISTRVVGPTKEFVVSKYRATQSFETKEKAEQLRILAAEYFTLQRDIQRRSKLHQLDTGAEEQLSPKELSRRAAARAGLKLPKLDPGL